MKRFQNQTPSPRRQPDSWSPLPHLVPSRSFNQEPESYRPHKRARGSPTQFGLCSRSWDIWRREFPVIMLDGCEELRKNWHEPQRFEELVHHWFACEDWQYNRQGDWAFVRRPRVQYHRWVVRRRFHAPFRRSKSETRRCWRKTF